MSFSSDFITRMLNMNCDDLFICDPQMKVIAFICDPQMKVIAVNETIKESGLAIRPGQTLQELFVGCTDQLEAALQKLKLGTLFYSTNFEFSLVRSTIFMIPVMEGGSLSSIVCYLISSSEERVLPDPNIVLPFISDRYRTPISNILNILQMFAGRFQAAEDYAALDYLNAAAQNCYGMLKSAVMVNRYYNLVNNRSEYHPEWHDLSDFLQNLWQSLRALMISTQYSLVLETEPASILTRFDEKLMSLAVLNLVANSCVYSPSDSKITITLSKKGDSAYITVADEGIGIERGDIEKIFDPFYSKRDVCVTEEQLGLGLGLPIAKKIVELHGGRIFVTSEPNHGTTVALRIPICPPAASEIHLRSGSVKYVTDRYSDLYLLFANICRIKLY